jgi:hypothetical protein
MFPLGRRAKKVAIQSSDRRYHERHREPALLHRLRRLSAFLRTHQKADIKYTVCSHEAALDGQCKSTLITLREEAMQTRLKRACLSAAFAGVFAAVLAGTLLAQADPQVGTWKLNLAKSKYSPGPAPKSATTKMEAAGAGTKVIVDQPQADGTVRHWEYTSNYDGKDVAVTGNNPDADMIARTRVNANTVRMVSKKNGRVTTTQTSTVSSDGKTRTVTTTGTNAAGQTVNNVAVYEKQ